MDRSIVSFIHLLENLKTTKRTGWINKGVPDPESIADHQYRMAILVQLVADRTVDKQRCVLMALVHDMAEAIVGDLTPECGLSAGEKHALEASAFKQLSALVPAPLSTLMTELWEEYAADATPEARLCKDIDKFEFVAQCTEYGKRHPHIELDDFIVNAQGKIRHPEVLSWLRELLSP